MLELERAVADAEQRSAREVLEQYETAIDELGDTTEIIALSHHPSDTAPKVRFVRVHSAMLKAPKWFLEEVVVPKPAGMAKLKQAHDYIDLNPECGRSSLRVQLHHIHHRQHGGGDEWENLAPLCTCCHLRGVHRGLIRMERSDGFLCFRYPDRTVALKENIPKPNPNACFEAPRS